MQSQEGKEERPEPTSMRILFEEPNLLLVTLPYAIIAGVCIGGILYILFSGGY